MHNEGYHVVRNNINAYYVVCCKWMAKLKDDPNSFTYYPPSNTHYQSLKKQIEAAPDWDFEQVKIMLANVQNLAEANRYITIRTKHIDSEASENEQRMKSYKRKHPVAGILNLDFNNMITQEFNLSHNKKLKTLAPIHEEGSMESDDEGNSAMIKDSKTPKESVSYTNSFNEDKSSKSNNVEIEQLQDVQIEQVAWFAINISKPNNGFGKHNGLVAGLLKIYFDAEFVRKIGWTSIKGKFTNKVISQLLIFFYRQDSV
ncbi:hypothetical protein ACKWTF_012375 [Chironomus riparius]